MGLFEKIFGRPKKTDIQAAFKALTAYQPVFTSWSGGLYESELVRAAIHAKAKHMSKLAVTVQGAANPKLQTRMRTGPNEWQTWGQFLYRLDTILEMQNTAFIVPVLDEFGRPSGVYPILPSRCEVTDHEGRAWLRYSFSNGQDAAMEMDRVGTLTKMQYESDFFGENNSALTPTMDLINVQNQGIQEGVKSAATYRFMAQYSNFSKPDDLAKERKRFTRENLEDGGGLLLFPNTYTNIQQIKSSPYSADAEQMKIVESNVYHYFGVNADILENKTYGDAWAAFYEGEVEPFAIQLSDVLTKMLFTERERAQGSAVSVTANRLQYMSTAEKINYATQMGDRGFVTVNEIREVFNLPPLLKGGDRMPIRGEYYNANDKEGENGKSNG